MPLYEYRCPQCGVFERMQKFSDPVLTVCPTCDQPVEKLLSAPAIQFKGSGWYVTDYADKGGKKKEASGESSSGSSGDSSGDSGGGSGSEGSGGGDSKSSGTKDSGAKDSSSKGSGGSSGSSSGSSSSD